MTSRLFNVISISIASLFLYACSHPIEIVGQGDVTSASGNRNCYLEDFQQAKVNCTKNYAVGAYQETYYAAPRPGWQFDHWGNNYCPNATPPNYDCSFNIPAATVQQFWGQTMPPLKAVFKTCTPGTPGCSWKTNNLTTYSQTNWGSSTTTAGILLNAKFYSLYGSNFTLGGNNTITFRSAGALLGYLPDSGNAGVLTGSLIDSTSSSAGEFAGEVIALQLNVDFSDAGLLSSITPLGELSFCNTGLATLDGQTVNQFLAVANILLGNGPGTFTPATTTAIARTVNEAFAGGTPSSFAQASLVNGPCP